MKYVTVTLFGLCCLLSCVVASPASDRDVFFAAVAIMTVIRWDKKS